MPVISLLPTPVSQAIQAPLVIVMPIYNEATNIHTVIEEWSSVLETLGTEYQFLLINDGSKDDTLSVLHRIESGCPTRVIVVDKPNSGHGRSCRLGYDAACAAPAVQWVLQIDSDGQCNPAYFGEFWKRRESADCVFGVRVKRDDGFVRTLTSTLCRYGSTLVTGQMMGDANVPYRLIRRNALEQALKHVPTSFDIHNVALTFVLKKMNNIRWEYVPIHFRGRQGGSNSINVANVTRLGLGMICDLNRLRKARIA